MREKVIVLLIILGSVVFAVGLTALMIESAERRSEGWEYISGDLYRRADCAARVLIYRESRGISNQLETEVMSSEQYEVFCVSKD